MTAFCNILPSPSFAPTICVALLLIHTDILYILFYCNMAGVFENIALLLRKKELV